MKITNKTKETFIKNQLATNANWALKALVSIYVKNQTCDEKEKQTTIENNGIGFSGTDGAFLSSLAQQAQQRRSLSEKQMVVVFKLMPKYWRQVLQMSDQEKIEKLILSA
jgi:hypothetical protein